MGTKERIGVLRATVEEYLVDCSDILTAGSFPEGLDLRADKRLRGRLTRVIYLIEKRQKVKLLIPTNSCYRPFYTTCGSDWKGLTDIRDSKGHWSGLAIDISLSRLAWAIWGERAFRGGVRRYDNLIREYKVELVVNIFKKAGLRRIFINSGGEWWHFSRRDWRPPQSIRKERYALGERVGAL